MGILLKQSSPNMLVQFNVNGRVSTFPRDKRARDFALDVNDLNEFTGSIRPF